MRNVSHFEVTDRSEPVEPPRRSRYKNAESNFKFEYDRKIVPGNASKYAPKDHGVIWDASENAEEQEKHLMNCIRNAHVTDYSTFYKDDVDSIYLEKAATERYRRCQTTGPIGTSGTECPEEAIPDRSPPYPAAAEKTPHYYQYVPTGTNAERKPGILQQYIRHGDELEAGKEITQDIHDTLPGYDATRLATPYTMAIYGPEHHRMSLAQIKRQKEYFNDLRPNETLFSQEEARRLYVSPQEMQLGRARLYEELKRQVLIKKMEYEKNERYRRQDEEKAQELARKEFLEKQALRREAEQYYRCNRRGIARKTNFVDIRPGEAVYDDRMDEARVSEDQYLSQHNKVYGYAKNYTSSQKHEHQHDRTESYGDGGRIY